MQSGHNLAHAMTAELSWHVPNCDLIIAVHVKSNIYLFKYLDYGLIYHLWNRSTINFLQSTHNGHPHISTMLAKHYVSFVSWRYHLNGSVQERRNFIANALELCLSYTNPSICVQPLQLPCYMWYKRIIHNVMVPGASFTNKEYLNQHWNRMAWQWAETLVESRGILADIRGTTK